MNGNDIFISLDGTSTPFAATKSNEIQVDVESKPVSSPNNGDWEEHIAVRKKWGFSVNWLVGDITKIENLLMVGNTYNIRVYSRSGNTKTLQLQGRASCLSAKVTSTKGSLANGSFSFDGNGPLSISNFISVTGITLSAPSYSMTVGQISLTPVTANVTPANATYKRLAWTSSDTSVAVVVQHGDDYTIEAVAPGECRLVATAKDGSDVSSYVEVTIAQ